MKEKENVIELSHEQGNPKKKALSECTNTALKLGKKFCNNMIQLKNQEFSYNLSFYVLMLEEFKTKR